MASSEPDWTVSKSYELDSTEGTTEEDEESTDGTTDEEVSMAADSTEATQDKFVDDTDMTIDKFGADSTDLTKHADDTDATVDKVNGIGRAASSKIPASEIVVRHIAIERSAPVAALAADSDAAFGQWLAGSGLPSLN